MAALARLGTEAKPKQRGRRSSGAVGREKDKAAVPEDCAKTVPKTFQKVTSDHR